MSLSNFSFANWSVLAVLIISQNVFCSIEVNLDSKKEVVAASSNDEPVQIDIQVELGEDLGSNLGGLFEAYDADGNVIFGAGFSDDFSSYVRSNNRTLQF